VAQAAEKREMTGRPNNEILIASFRAVELLLLMLLLDRFEIFPRRKGLHRSQVRHLNTKLSFSH
jgi:hypothetical protein